MCTFNICSFNKEVVFTIKQFFHKLHYFSCFSVMSLCSLACTWMTIIDSKFYIINCLSLDVSFE